MRTKSAQGDGKCLVAFFSRPGKNYVGGKIVDLPVGNTEVVAKMIGKITGGDLFRIEPVKAYPDDYTETTDVAKEELRVKALPEITGSPGSLGAYGTIFLGYPNWWGTFPRPVATFLSRNDPSGRTIAPFCTHEGSGPGHSVADLRDLCPDSTVLEALAIRGSEVRSAGDAVAGWLCKIGKDT